MTAVAIVTNFANLLQEENFEAVAEIIHDDFQFKPPAAVKRAPSSVGKNEWLEGYRTAKSRPVYEAPEVGQHDKQVVRKGKVKFSPMMKFNIIQTIELNDDGKIIQIEVNKA